MASKSDRMWRLLGRSVAKGQARSRDEVERSTQFDSWASGLGDGDIAQAAKEMRSASLPDLPRFLALARQASIRSLDMRPFDTQLLGAVRLLAGDVIEMATGEGKTLSGAIAAAGFVLHDRRTHVISVNDFLARRDAAWMAPFYELLGLTVGWIDAESSAAERRAAYACDVTYGSVNEIGFDVLRDHLVTDIADLVSPVPDVALIDEADSVLVDEALVPLVLAGDASSDVPTSEVFEAVENLEVDVHYETDADNRNVFLTDAGAEKIEADLGGIDLYSEEHVGSTLVQVNVALHAQVLVRKDVHYIVREGRVQLINSSRGRVAQLQRWPDGLQAAVEAKEGVAHTETGEVLDTITVQALIGRYPTVCGMTGTALAAGEQLRKFYGLGVSVIASNEPMIRIDEPDRVYAHADQKTAAIVDFVSEVHATGQPILIGTQDVAESEALSEELQRASVPVVVLNAKNDAEEAAVIAAAGKFGAVTVSTQIAGRGTDIKLGGPDQAERNRVADLGGLLVIGTGRHTTERLDNQLRGRAGRQGDPGRSVFFASWEDMIVTNYLDPGEKPGKSDDDGLVTAPNAAHQVDHAQRIAEGSMLEAHSLTWKYNQLTAQHREIVDERRSTLLRTDDASTMLTEHNPQRADELRVALGEAALSQAAREIVLYHLDRSWSDYLAHLADVRESIHLRALGRQNPLDEFHRIAIDAFGTLVSKATELSQGTFDTVALTDDGIDLDSAGMKRPTSTWTYMVHDNPFASNGGEASSIFRP